MQKIFLILFCLPFITGVMVQAQEDTTGWNLAKQKNGIEIYTRLAEGSKFKEYKAIATFSAEPVELVEALLDVENYVNWMAHVKKTELLDQPSDTVFYCYTEVKVPWPFDNRDDITRSVISHNKTDGSYTIDIYLEPEYLPEKKGIIRMVDGGGVWVFTPLGDGTTRIHNQFMGDPAGNIPAWIVNMFLVDGPYKTMLGLQELVEKQ